MTGLRNLIPPPLFFAALALLWFALQYEADWQFHRTNGHQPSTGNIENAVSDQTTLDWENPYLVDPLKLDEAVERPLFSDTRRPPKIAEPVAQEVVIPKPIPETPEPVRPQEPDLEFLGIVRSGQSTSALVRNNGTGEEVWARPGLAIGQWQVVTISEHSLTLESGTFEYVVRINQ